MVLLGGSAIATILLSGLFYGGILSLIAVGLTLIFGVSRVMNIAHGDLVFIGGAVTSVLFANYFLNPFLSIVVVIPLFAGIGALFNFLMRKPIASKSAELSLAASVLITLGLSDIIEGLGAKISSQYNYNCYAVPSSQFSIGSTTLFGAQIDNILAVSFIAIIAISVGLTLLVYRTPFGALMRASMADREVALMLGADTSRVTLITFIVGTALAGLAGTIEAMNTCLAANVGLSLTISALTVVVLGGLGSFYGSLIGGFIIGIVTSVVEIVEAYSGVGGWDSAVPLLLLILILIARPSGLLKR
ncbi:MAG: branched-chain amino acid ABC transporter permease [Thaumarchaeota archaeon]|nr:branched-chain amino acid ABC transporter permease [Nitrososphaerota archaeon]